jgi:transposase
MARCPLAIRTDRSADDLRRLARHEADPAAASRMPEISTAVMNIFLARFSAKRAADEHALMVMDGAGWHQAHDLNVPSNVSLLTLPAYSPELNPIERIWLYLRERHLSHRLLNSYEAIVDACCRAWNELTAERIKSLTSHPYLEQVKI